MPNKKNKSSKKRKQIHRPSDPTSGLPPPPQAAGSASSGPSTTTGTYKCLRLPADGSPPERLDYTATAESIKGPDSYLNIIPDLRAYWHDDYLARKMQPLVVEEQSSAALNGNYIIYYSIDPSMEANKTLLSMPGVHDAVEKSVDSGEKFGERVFYRGDVFVVRLKDCIENTNFKAEYDDITPPFVQPLMQILERVFKSNWEEKFLEKQRKDDAYFDKFLGEYERSHAEMTARLSPEEQGDPVKKLLIEMLAMSVARGEGS